MITRNIDGRKITLSDKSIGPAHDPYGQEEITITVGDRSASFMSNGLGQCRLHLIDGELAERIEAWHGIDKQAETKAQLLARRLVGISFDDARDAI